MSAQQMLVQATGGCACGQFTYEFAAVPQMSVNCHCRDCQKTSGASHLSIFMIDADKLIIRGQLRYYATQADSGATTKRGFCPNCGSLVLGSSSAHPEAAIILAASVDDPSWYAPSADIFVNSALPWQQMDAGIAKYCGAPG